MTNNVDLDIDLDDGIEDDLLDVYIRMYMSSASYEVFQREKENMTMVEAAGKALLNEALLTAIKIGMMIDKTETDEQNNGAIDNLTIILNAMVNGK